MDTDQLESFRVLIQSAQAKISQHIENRISERVEESKRAIEAQNQITIKVESTKLAAKKIHKSKRMAAIQKEVVDTYKRFFYFLIVHLFSAAPTLGLLLLAIIVSLPLGLLIGLNLPDVVMCKDRQGICYQWRSNRETVIFTEEKD